MEDKRLNRHTNPSKYKPRKRSGKHRIFFKKRNREAKEVLKAMA